MAGLYVHIPFCEHKCMYCDFYSIAPSEERQDDRALHHTFNDRLLREIEIRATQPYLPSAFDTIFFGGGTPSLLEPEHAGAVLERLHRQFRIEDRAEVTLEANPGTVSLERLRSFRAMGFNRISLGVQSFNDDELRFLTRIHSADQAVQSLRHAREAEFENLSIDLMFGLPDQTVEGWLETLRTAVELEPDHISCYSLTVEATTPLARMVGEGRVKLPGRDIDADLYERTIEYLGSSGFVQYEVSNFCKPDHESRHNVNYWKHGEYVGFGPSAHSYTGGVRRWNSANISLYNDRLSREELPVEGEEELTRDQLRDERIFLGLRGPGIDLRAYEQAFGSSFLAERREKVSALLSDGMAAIRGQILSLTSRGYMVCDEICASLIS